jgi:hypothetical protein
MTHLSEFELIASIIAKDRYFMEVDEHGVSELLTNILRACYDYSNSPKWDVDDLGGLIGSLILDWTGADLVSWPEEMGAGPVKWDEVDGCPNERPLQPGELDPETGLYNPNEVPMPRDEPVKREASKLSNMPEQELAKTVRKLSAVPHPEPVPRDLPPLEGFPTAGA